MPLAHETFRAPSLVQTGLAESRERMQAVQIRTLIASSERLVEQLDATIRLEEQRTKISAPRRVEYSTIASAALTRRNNLLRSIAILREPLGRP